MPRSFETSRPRELRRLRTSIGVCIATWLKGEMKDVEPRERVERLSVKPRAALRPSLLSVAQRRTPGCRFASWGTCERRRCVVTLGAEDLRVYVADHKPPTIFELKRLELRRGLRHLELSRSTWAQRLFRRLCCCEPFTCRVSLRLDQALRCLKTN